ncbi:MAG: prolyl aminopeptidase [Rhodobacteraceae bacterium]|nr:prolyl aminopeptidase [Paracoccaceae bacterium]
MPEHTSPQASLARLHPPREPYMTERMEMTNGHRLYVEQSGNPCGIPVVVLHGGPGGGCTPAMRRYFDPAKFRTILFDQRGCGRSTPFASVEHNTTWDLVADIERIRIRLGIKKWVVFGGSWGATLSLLYGQAHPARVQALVLRGVFTLTKAELDWFYGGGAGAFWPEAWALFKGIIPQAEQGDLIKAYNKRLFGNNKEKALQAARIWTGWENTLATLVSDGLIKGAGTRYAEAFARIENHYFSHGGWLDHEHQITTNMPRLHGIKGYIVQGRYDMVCPPHTAYKIHHAWPDSELRMVNLAGHAMSETGVAAELVSIMEQIGSEEGRHAENL